MLESILLGCSVIYKGLVLLCLIVIAGSLNKIANKEPVKDKTEVDLNPPVFKT